MRSALGRSLSQTYRGIPLRLQISFNNRSPLTECYNRAIASAGRDEVLVFVHDDVHLIDFFWIGKILQGLHQFDVVGVAGNKRRLPGQTSWAFIDDKGTWDNPSNLSGIVGHGSGFPCNLASYGPPGERCKLLDGVFLAARKATLDQAGITFDQQFDFHFYDLDFCRQAETKRLKLGTIPLCLVHESGGSFSSDQWKLNRTRYLAKWKE